MDEIPPLTHPENMPPVRTQEDLHRLWRALMGKLGFGSHSLWLLVLEDDGQPTGMILQVEDRTLMPADDESEHLARFCRMLVDEVGFGQIVFLLSGPGPAGITASERRWAEVLHDAVRRAGLPVWPVHRANDHELVVIAPDDLAVSA